MVRFVLSLIIVVAASSNASIMRANDGDARKVTEIINKVNRHWQHAHPEPGTAFWHNAVYHIGNMEAWRLTGDTAYYEYLFCAFGRTQSMDGSTRHRPNRMEIFLW